MSTRLGSDHATPALTASRTVGRSSSAAITDMRSSRSMNSRPGSCPGRHVACGASRAKMELSEVGYNKGELNSSLQQNNEPPEGRKGKVSVPLNPRALRAMPP